MQPFSHSGRLVSLPDQPFKLEGEDREQVAETIEPYLKDPSRLEEALERENYELAAQVRDEISTMETA